MSFYSIMICKKSNDSFDKYVVEGGMSASYSQSFTFDRITYLKSVYNTIILRDLVQKYNIKDEPL